MAWSLETQTGEVEWVQWIDLEAAEAWRSVIVGWVDARVPDRWEDQQRAVRSLLTALGAFARACDLPVQSFEPWARTLLQRDPGPDPLPIGYPASPWRVEALARIRRHSEDAREWSEAQFITDLAHRVGLTREGLLVETRIGATYAPDTPRGADYRRQDGGEHGGTFWAALAWSEWYPPFGAAERVAWSVSVVPLLWHWTQAQAAARIVADNDLRAIVSRCRAWVKAKNLLTARAVGGAVPEDIVTAMRDSLLLSTAGPPRMVRGIYGSVAAGLALAIPIGPAIALVVSGIIEGLYALGGAAVAYQIDVWGRREPVLEVERLSGVVTTRERRAPTHPVQRPTAEVECPAAWRARVEGAPVDGGGVPIFVPFVAPLEGTGGAPPPPPPPPPASGGWELPVLAGVLAKAFGWW